MGELDFWEYSSATARRGAAGVGDHPLPSLNGLFNQIPALLGNCILCGDFWTSFDAGLTSKGELSYCSYWPRAMLSQASPKILPKAAKAAQGLGALSGDTAGGKGGDDPELSAPVGLASLGPLSLQHRQLRARLHRAGRTQTCRLCGAVGWMPTSAWVCSTPPGLPRGLLHFSLFFATLFFHPVSRRESREVFGHRDTWFRSRALLSWGRGGGRVG